jgi:hypothetical protein
VQRVAQCEWWEMDKQKEKILTLTEKDFRFDFYRGTGAGGQKVNKTASACRCTHVPSGAVGQSQDERVQHVNKKLAFRRCVGSKKFQTWIRLEASAVLMGFVGLEEKIDKSMAERNIKVEQIITFRCDGRNCTSTQEATFLEGEIVKVPLGWKSFDGGIHLCPKCGKEK